MQRFAPILFFVVGCLIIALSILGAGGLPSLEAARASLQSQEEKNEELREQVNALRSFASEISTNNRTLEKAARNELGMARPNEKIFIFEDEDSTLIPVKK